MNAITASQIKDWCGILIGVCGVFATILVFLKSKKKKRLSYQTLFDSPMLTIDDEIAEHIKIFLRDVEVKNVRFLSIEINNNGNTPILKNEFETPITIQFAKDTLIMATRIRKKFPENIEIDINFVGDRADFNTLLLNPNDYFIVDFILDSDKVDFNITARIVGVSQIGVFAVTNLDKFINISSILLALSGPGIGIILAVLGVKQWIWVGTISILLIFFIVTGGFYVLKKHTLYWADRMTPNQIKKRLG